MKLRISGLLAIVAFLVACLLGAAQSLAQNAYITNGYSNSVSVIDTATNTVTATIAAGFLGYEKRRSKHAGRKPHAPIGDPHRC
jgi:YVTN family beta-propeller protein